MKELGVYSVDGGHHEGDVSRRKGSEGVRLETGRWLRDSARALWDRNLEGLVAMGVGVGLTTELCLVVMVMMMVRGVMVVMAMMIVMMMMMMLVMLVMMVMTLVLVVLVVLVMTM